MKEPKFNIGDKVVPINCSKSYQKKNMMIVSDIEERIITKIIENEEWIWKRYVYITVPAECGRYGDGYLEKWNEN